MSSKSAGLKIVAASPSKLSPGASDYNPTGPAYNPTGPSSSTTPAPAPSIIGLLRSLPLSAWLRLPMTLTSPDLLLAHLTQVTSKPSGNFIWFEASVRF